MIVHKVEPTAAGNAEISVKGRLLRVSSIQVDGWTIVVQGKWARVARIRGAEWIPGADQIDPAQMIRALEDSGLEPDWFTFQQKFTQSKPRYAYRYEWDNVAAVPLTSYKDWWERQVSHDLRKDVKRAEKRGVVVRLVEFNDELIRGVKEIYDEVPFRQGRPFWHYGKDLETIKRENSSYLDRSIFLGAFFESELIGFIKIVQVDDVGRLLQILSKDAHLDKRPSNALIAKAIEVCVEAGCSYLTYGRYTYDNMRNSPLARFKRRNGFEEIFYPRYYVPMSSRGRLMTRAGLHLGYRRFLPEGPTLRLLDLRVKVRERIHRWKQGKLASKTAHPAAFEECE